MDARKRSRKTPQKTFVIVAATPEMRPKPETPAMAAMIRKLMA